LERKALLPGEQSRLQVQMQANLSDTGTAKSIIIHYTAGVQYKTIVSMPVGKVLPRLLSSSSVDFGRQDYKALGDSLHTLTVNRDSLSRDLRSVTLDIVPSSSALDFVDVSVDTNDQINITLRKDKPLGRFCERLKLVGDGRFLQDIECRGYVTSEYFCDPSTVIVNPNVMHSKCSVSIEAMFGGDWGIDEVSIAGDNTAGLSATFHEHTVHLVNNMTGRISKETDFHGAIRIGVSRGHHSPETINIPVFFLE